MDLVSEFVSSVALRDGHELEHKSEEILAQQYLGTIKNGKFIANNAGCLLLAKNPMLHFPGCKIRFQRFEGEHEGSGQNYAVIKDEIIEAAPLPKLIAQAESLLAGQLREYSALGKDGRFYSVPEYPRFVWYEAIVNGCGHRSYHLKNMNIFVKMFDDKLLITSPGALPPTVTPQNIFEVQNARNPYLMRALQHFGLVKCANEGTRRMRDEMLKANLPVPVFSEAQDGGGNVTVTLQNNHKQRRAFIDKQAAKRVVSEAIYKTLSEEDLQLVNAVVEYGSVNVTQAARIISREWGTARGKLDKLVDKGVLKRIHRKDLLRDPKANYVLNVANGS
jgi:ATP-dependent DNA helicase RecG